MFETSIKPRSAWLNILPVKMFSTTPVVYRYVRSARTIFLSISLAVTTSACSMFGEPVAEPDFEVVPKEQAVEADNYEAVPVVDKTPAPLVAPATVAEAEAEYLLGQGDEIAIQVFDEPDLTMTTQVSASGVINYSYLGDITVANKTAQQIERDITALLQNGYLVNPSVNVSITEFRPFFINGEVRSPGGYPYQPGLTLDKAIALAGGLTDRASERKMFIIKAVGNDQEQERAKMQTKIAPGDIITIKEGFL